MGVPDRFWVFRLTILGELVTKKGPKSSLPVKLQSSGVDVSSLHADTNAQLARIPIPNFFKKLFLFIVFYFLIPLNNY